MVRGVQHDAPQPRIESLPMQSANPQAGGPAVMPKARLLL